MSGKVINNLKLEIKNISKFYPINGRRKTILDDISFSVKPKERVAILGLNGSGKSTLIRLIGGLEKPDIGRIDSTMTISWPLGYSGGTQGSLTGVDNIKFLARIYDSDIRNTIEYVAWLTELGSALFEPVRTYSAGMKARLNFALSMAFDFDCLLIDEGLSAGDQRFENKAQIEMEKKREQALIIVSHSENTIRHFCDKAYILQQGKLLHFETFDQAINSYRDIVQEEKGMGAKIISPIQNPQAN